MEVRKRIRKIAFRALALVGALVALTAFINLSWFDEELHPELAQFVPPQPVEMEGNAFPYVYGFAAANNQDPHATGVEIVETLRERHLAGERVTLSREEIDAILGDPPDEDWRQAFNSLSCNWRQELDCAEQLVAEVAQADIIDERLAVLLNRFETMLLLDRYKENQESDIYSPLPRFVQVMAASSIRLGMAFDEQPTGLVLNRIDTDIQFWKMMLRDSDLLISKMLALSGLRNSTQFLPALMRTRNLSPEELARIAEILTPLSDEERDIGEAFLSETRYVMGSIRSTEEYLRGLWSLFHLIYQENATTNDYYAFFTEPMRQRAALSASEHYEQLDESYARYSVPLFPPPLYNLGGKYFFFPEAELNSVTDYISRVHDMDGRIALVLLQAEILANPDLPIERVVGRSQYRNPYTQEAMDYDAASGILSFECLENRREVCAVEVRR